MSPAHSRGFSLIELMVTVSLAALLMAVAVPAFTTWVANSKVRAVTETLQSGIRLAQTEAMRLNRTVVFSLTNDVPSNAAKAVASGRNWAVNITRLATEDDAVKFVQGGLFGSSGDGVTITLSSPADATAICFGFTGRLVATSTSGVTDAKCLVDVNPVAFDVSTSAGDRPLRALVSLGGQVRMCDPKRSFSTANPDGCP